MTIRGTGEATGLARVKPSAHPLLQLRATMQTRALVLFAGVRL